MSSDGVDNGDAGIPDLNYEWVSSRNSGVKYI